MGLFSHLTTFCTMRQVMRKVLLVHAEVEVCRYTCKVYFQIVYLKFSLHYMPPHHSLLLSHNSYLHSPAGMQGEEKGAVHLWKEACIKHNKGLFSSCQELLKSAIEQGMQHFPLLSFFPAPSCTTLLSFPTCNSQTFTPSQFSKGQGVSASLNLTLVPLLNNNRLVSQFNVCLENREGENMLKTGTRMPIYSLVGVVSYWG